MATLQDAANFAADTTLHGQVAAAMVRVVANLANEDHANPYFGVRAGYATVVIGDVNGHVPGMMWAISSNDELVDAWAANDTAAVANLIQQAVADAWSMAAGAF